MCAAHRLYQCDNLLIYQRWLALTGLVLISVQNLLDHFYQDPQLDLRVLNCVMQVPGIVNILAIVYVRQSIEQLLVI